MEGYSFPSLKRKTFELKPVYEDPDHELKAAPGKKTRATRQGEIVGDFLVYGDCLSWGVSHKNKALFGVPDTGRIHKDDKYRWTHYIKQNLEAKGFRLIENCMFNRTTCYNDPSLPRPFLPTDFNGEYDFGVVFESHSPLWLVIFLGTHDLKRKIREENNITPERIVENISNLCLQALEMFTSHCHFGNSPVKKDLNILIIVPPKVVLTEQSRALGFDEISVEYSLQLPFLIKQMCERYNFIHVHRRFQMTGSEDGVHLTKKACKKLAGAVWSQVKKKLPRDVRAPKKLVLNGY